MNAEVRRQTSWEFNAQIDQSFNHWCSSQFGFSGVCRRESLDCRIYRKLLPLCPRPGATLPTPLRHFPRQVPSRLYDRQTVSVHSWKLALRLYGEGRLSLEYIRPDMGFFEYRGHYSRADSSIVFSFDGWSIAGPWLATGIRAATPASSSGTMSSCNRPISRMGSIGRPHR